MTRTRTTRTGSLLIISVVVLLSACNPEEKDGPERKATDITSENTVLSFSSEAQGDYPVVTNLSFNNPVSAHPLAATIPELFKLEQADELEQYLQSSEALGFDREAFDNFYNVAWELIEAVRYSFVEDAMGQQISHADDIPQQLNIIETLDPGERGRKVSFRYAINQTYESSRCKHTEASCEFTVEIDILFYFPESKISISPRAGDLHLGWNTLQVQILKFHIRNEHTILDLSADEKNIVYTSFDSHFNEVDPSKNVTTSNSLSRVVNSDTQSGEKTNYQPMSIAIDPGIFSSGEIWSNERGSNNFGENGLIGVFENTIIDEEGFKKTVRLTGHIHASFPEYLYFRSFLDDNYTYPAFTDQFGKLDEDNVVPLDRNTMTGYLWGVDVEVQFATDITE